jgi:hypothetical protein
VRFVTRPALTKQLTLDALDVGCQGLLRAAPIRAVNCGTQRSPSNIPRPLGYLGDTPRHYRCVTTFTV